jgi:gas vesicle protein
LGEIIGDSRDAFELSYIENALTSNPVLQTHSRASRKDQLALFNAARRQTMEGMDLTGNLSADQVSDIYQVLTKLMRARDVVLKVNRAYIQSASQADSYRTEPPFKLQGSYRNMNRIAEKIVPVMNDDELRELLIANYEQDAQTLTRDGESNLLKFYELLGEMSPEQSSRWEQIKYAYVEGVRMQGVDGEDSAAQLLRSLTGLRDGLESIRRTIEHAVSSEESIKDRTVLGEGLEQLSQNVSHLGEAVSQQVQAAALELKQLLDRANSELPEQKVLVQHSVPRVMTDLVRSQFQLLYDGLRPALEASALSRKQLEQLQKSIDECLSEYRDLQAEIERSEKDD